MTKKAMFCANISRTLLKGWGVVCGDGWSLLEAGVICRQLGLGYATDAVESNFFGGQKIQMVISGIECHGNEWNLAECLHDKVVDCPGTP